MSPRAQNAPAKDLLVKLRRPFDIGDGDEMRDGEAFARRHFIIFLFDLYHGASGQLFGIARAGVGDLIEVARNTTGTVPIFAHI